MTKPDVIVFEAQKIICEDLATEVEQQQKVYEVIQLYSRKSIKTEIANAYNILATSSKHSGFIQQITAIFKNC